MCGIASNLLLCYILYRNNLDFQLILKNKAKGL